MSFKSILNRLFETMAVDSSMSNDIVPAPPKADNKQAKVRKSEITELFRSALDEKQREMLLRRTGDLDRARTDRRHLKGMNPAGRSRGFQAQALRLTNHITPGRPNAK